jgi:hypothetical protein
VLDAGPTNPHTSLHLSGGLLVQRQVASTNGEAPASVGAFYLRCYPNSEALVLIKQLNSPARRYAGGAQEKLFAMVQKGPPQLAASFIRCWPDQTFACSGCHEFVDDIPDHDDGH